MPGWVLTTGQWIDGWVFAPDAASVEVRSGQHTIHRATPSIPRPDVAANLELPRGELPLGFRDQVDLAGCDDLIGPLRLVVVRADGDERIVAESAAGIVLGTLSVSRGFALYALDNREADEQPLPGRALIAAIRARGERVVVDLGCGFRKEGNIGIDAKTEGTQADIVCRLGFDPIPLDDESVDEVFARDFLEHIPKGVWSERERQMHYPVIQLMNEVWRILKPGGVFTSFTPCFPKPEAHQDPTHLSVWTLNSMAYFCGRYPVARVYGVEAEFEMVTNRLDGFYLYAVLKKPL